MEITTGMVSKQHAQSLGRGEQSDLRFHRILHSTLWKLRVLQNANLLYLDLPGDRDSRFPFSRFVLPFSPFVASDSDFRLFDNC